MHKEFIDFFQLEISDFVKILLSLTVGIILGSERELKDKSAGFKTIATICLGSTLFTILSLKIGLMTDKDSTRIASYVVSGIGFLGAGVIFKDKFNVHGLTTASIIWVAAAIGMAIGFGEFGLGFIFLMASLFIVVSGKYLNKLIFGKKAHKQLTLSLNDASENKLKDLIQNLKTFCLNIEIKHMQKENGHLILTLDIFIKEVNFVPLNMYLYHNKNVENYQL